jgi:hypothetical protein
VGNEIFRSRPDRPWGPPSFLYKGLRVSFLGVKRPGRGVDHPPPSSASVKERVLHLTKAQKGVYYSAIKIYNSLPQIIKKLSVDANKFKVTLKKFLLINSFYSLDEYFAYDAKHDLDKN